MGRFTMWILMAVAAVALSLPGAAMPSSRYDAANTGYAADAR